MALETAARSQEAAEAASIALQLDAEKLKTVSVVVRRHVQGLALTLEVLNAHQACFVMAWCDVKHAGFPACTPHELHVLALHLHFRHGLVCSIVACSHACSRWIMHFHFRHGLLCTIVACSHAYSSWMHRAHLCV